MKAGKRLCRSHTISCSVTEGRNHSGSFTSCSMSDTSTTSMTICPVKIQSRDLLDDLPSVRMYASMPHVR